MPESWGLLKAFLWLAAALLHMPAIASAAGFGQPQADWLRMGTLLLGMAFCLLKAADVAALRLKPGWRPCLVGLLALVLIHAGMMPGIDDSVADQWAATAMGTTAFVWMRPSLAHLLKRKNRKPCDRPKLILPLVGLASEWLLPGCQPLLCRINVTPRAPPHA